MFYKKLPANSVEDLV